MSVEAREFISAAAEDIVLEEEQLVEPEKRTGTPAKRLEQAKNKAIAENIGESKDGCEEKGE